jgi:hypothetical protein
VPSYEVLEDLGYGRKLVRFTDGPQTGSEVVLVPRPTPGDFNLSGRREPEPHHRLPRSGPRRYSSHCSPRTSAPTGMHAVAS